ncbi:MAG: lysoplasmalogenase [Erythrobacter sp.]|nr:lysoplasmalogenase [Erythrobacter sp.]
MARRALVQHRPWLALSLIAGIAYPLLDESALGGLWVMGIKASAVGFLAVYAAQRTRGLRAGLFVLALALSAVGDAAIQLSLMAGGIAFAASHVAAILFYRRHLRPEPSVARKWASLGLLLAVPVGCLLLSGDWTIGIYGVALGGMAMAAWLSLFPQWRVGLGALFFVFSDWLIFSRVGPIDLAPLPDLLVWPTYYVGQLMIATGVVQTLRRFRR